MVEVDVFWSFAIGAGFAVSASRQIKHDDEQGRFSLLENRYFTQTLIFLSCVLAPASIYLLWAFPAWETMFVWSGPSDMPAWIVVLFAITLVTQGILGFWWASWLIRRDRLGAAGLLALLGYFAMAFMLIHGWDGTSYRRVFSRTMEEWRFGGGLFVGWMALRFLVSPIALTMYVMALIALPLLFGWMSAWIQRGYELAPIERERIARQGRPRIIRLIARLILVHALGSALVTSLLLRLMGRLFGPIAGWVLGLAASFALIYFIGLRPGGLIRRDAGRLMLRDF